MKSDIGNLYPQIKAASEQSGLSLSYLSRNWSDMEQWRILGRAKLFESLAYAPEPPEQSSRTLEVKRRHGYLEETVELHTAKGVSTLGTLLIPDQGPGPYPCIIALHDHGGYYAHGREKIIAVDREPGILTEFKRDIYDGRSWASEWAKQGYVVFVIDAFYFGVRKLDLETVSDYMRERCPHKPSPTQSEDEWIDTTNQALGYMETLTVKHITAAGTTWPGIMMFDDRASIDYVSSRSEVDPERIGCCGLSMGGYRSALLAGLDSRIRCAVVVGFMTSYGDELYNRFRNQSFPVYIPQLYAYLDFPDIVSLNAPAPLLVQQCKQDHLFTGKGMKNAEDKLRSVYSRMGAPERLSVTWHNLPHKFSLEMQDQALSWMDRWLKMKEADAT